MNGLEKAAIVAILSMSAAIWATLLLMLWQDFNAC
jgi:hypothetical protein